jgi:hypothetical protein
MAVTVQTEPPYARIDARIERLKSQLAELVKRNPTGLDDPPAGADTAGVQR